MDGSTSYFNNNRDMLLLTIINVFANFLILVHLTNIFALNGYFDWNLDSASKLKLR